VISAFASSAAGSSYTYSGGIVTNTTTNLVSPQTVFAQPTASSSMQDGSYAVVSSAAALQTKWTLSAAPLEDFAVAIASFKPAAGGGGPSTYALNVTSGTGSGNYTNGAVVGITANAAPSGQVFSAWVINSGNPTIADTNAASTTLVMPANAAAVTATYRLEPRITSIAPASGGNLSLGMPTVVGSQYILEYTPTLFPTPTWTPLSTNAGTGGTLTNTVPVDAGTVQRFFRYLVR